MDGCDGLGSPAAGQPPPHTSLGQPRPHRVPGRRVVKDVQQFGCGSRSLRGQPPLQGVDQLPLPLALGMEDTRPARGGRRLSGEAVPGAGAQAVNVLTHGRYPAQVPDLRREEGE